MVKKSFEMKSSKSLQQKSELSSVFNCLRDIYTTVLNGEKFPFGGQENLSTLKVAMTAFLEKAQVQTQSLAQAQKRLEDVLGVVTDLANLKFDRVLDLAGDEGPMDGLITGINMLAEELKYSVVSRSDLEKSERKFRSIFEQKVSGVVFVDVGGNILKCNERYAEIHGLAHHEMIGKNVTELVFREDQATSAKAAEKLASGEVKNISHECRHLHVNGSLIWCLLNASRVENEHGNLLFAVGILQDITGSKNLQEALIQSSKMTALGEMAGGIAHEINNPLGIVQGKARLLLKLIQRGELTPEYSLVELSKIVETSERIAKIIRGLRSFSRNAEKDPMASCELKVIVENVLGLCSERFKAHGIELRLTTVPELTFRCRAVQLEQVLLNLLNNACDAVATLTTKWVQIDFTRLEQKIQIFVTDSGSGIPSHIVDKLMQPFFTTKEVGKGTGLGLSISKGIIEDHHGQLRYDSLCSNTRFVIELPIPQS